MNDGILKIFLESKAHSLRNVSINSPLPQAEHFQENAHLYPEVLLYYFNPNYFHVIFLNFLSCHISWT